MTIFKLGGVDVAVSAREARVLATIDSLGFFGGSKPGELEAVEALNAERFQDVFSDPEDRAIAQNLARRYFPELRAAADRRTQGVVHGQTLAAPDSPLKRLFQPRWVAVIGASEDLSQVGGAVVRALKESPIPGGVVPIFAGSAELQGLKTAPSLAAIDPAPDLVMITVPAAEVPAALRACGERGVENVIVMSQGFESGEGRQRLVEVQELARQYGIKLVGPNSLGLITPRLNASYAAGRPIAGGIGLLSQSGAVVTGMLADLNTVGFSKVVALGNQAVLDLADFVTELGRDPETKVVTGYVEQITDGPRFVAAARAVSRNKPIVMLKSGKSEAGQQASMSHTGALGGAQAAYDAAFRRAGVVQVGSLDELNDVAKTFAAGQPLPKGRRVAVVTNTGGLGILAADEAARCGLSMAPLGEKTHEKLAALLPPTAGLSNPVDILGNARSDRYQAVIDILRADPEVDAVMVLVSPQSMTDSEAIARAVVATPKDKPIVAAMLGQSRMAVADYLLQQGGVPSFGSTERAVRVLSRMAEAGEAARGADEPAVGADIDLPAVARTEAALGWRAGGSFGTEALELLAAYGIPIAERAVCADAEAAATAAERIGFPVVMKIKSPDILHKSDVGGIALNLGSGAEVRRAFTDMQARVAAKAPAARSEGVEIQRQVPAERELIAGVVRDPVIGPMLMLGAGGTLVETLKDAAFELVPLSETRLDAMIKRLKAFPLLQGTRGQASIDFAALKEVLRRLSCLAEAGGEQLQEIEINPLIVSPAGAVACDARARTTPTRGP